MRKLFMMGLVFLLMPTTAFSQSQGQPGKELSFEMARAIERDPQRAIRQFAEMITRIDKSGVLSELAMNRMYMIRMAEARAKIIQPLIAMDLDFDGLISEVEIAAFEAGNFDRNKTEMILMVAEGDRDGDRQLTFEEMRYIAARRANSSRYMPRDYEATRDLLKLDLDNDGELTIPEMVEAVKRFNPGCSCVE